MKKSMVRPGLLHLLFTAVATTATAKRVVVALYGIQNRDRGCAWPSQQKNVIEVLKAKGFAVDVFRFDLMPADGDVVDKIAWHPRTEPLPSTFYKKSSLTEVDTKVSDICKNQQCRYRPNYDAVTTMHAKRQLFSEFKVGSFLRQHKDQFEAAVVIGSDILNSKMVD